MSSLYEIDERLVTLIEAQFDTEDGVLYEDAGELAKILLSPDRVFMYMPAVYAKPENCKYLDNGNAMYPNMLENPPYFKDGVEVRMYGNGRFYGIYQYVTDKKRLKPIKMFL